jgi:hypothetical protein
VNWKYLGDKGVSGNIKNIWANQIGGNVKLIGFVEYIKNIWGYLLLIAVLAPRDWSPPGEKATCAPSIARWYGIGLHATGHTRPS